MGWNAMEHLSPHYHRKKDPFHINWHNKQGILYPKSLMGVSWIPNIDPDTGLGIGCSGDNICSKRGSFLAGQPLATLVM